MCFYVCYGSVCVCMCVCVLACVLVCVAASYKYVCLYVSLHVYLYVWPSSVCVCLYVFLYVCLCVVCYRSECKKAPNYVFCKINTQLQGLSPLTPTGALPLVSTGVSGLCSIFVFRYGRYAILMILFYAFIYF